MDALSLFTYFSVAVLVPCCGFSIDTERPVIFQEAAEGFGQTVVPFGRGADRGVLVGAPLQRGNANERGKIYKCQQTQSKCQEVRIQLPRDAVNISLGLSLSAWESRFLACGPTVHQTCGKNVYLKSYCFLLDQNLRQTRQFPDALPECAKRTNDIALLIDGSGSIKTGEFNQMKTFISEVMSRFPQSSDTEPF
ncbi:LOW QUALITY PROTEIN: integrin alpha-M-like [Sphaerodactylus townsendi]|uniref:LOW QUALITY PROTEIN: integrin alpha-M-like n=1 Tax=Sphaerodactylus townsendi TaxID=933632 RepID=UPI002025DEA1|nr:LOW QUALITY PROTEIN: integrin alpha-M-like [Sphaerodactylus townsendi]